RFFNLNNAQGAGRSLVSNAVSSICRDSRNNLWIGTFQGISIYNPQTGWVQNIAGGTDSKSGFPESAVQTIINDRSGNIWLGHSGAGPSKVKHNRGFAVFQPPVGSNQLSSKDIVSAVHRDAFDDIWVAIDDKGIYQLQFRDGIFHVIRHVPHEDAHGKIWGISSDRSGDLFVISERGSGLFVMQRETGRITPVMEGNFFIIKKDSRDRLWLSKGTELFLIEDLESRPIAIKQVFTDPAFRHHHHHVEYSTIIEDPDKRIWVTSWHGPVFFYNEASRQLEAPKISTVVEDFDTDNSRISASIFDEKGFLWLATFEGMCKYRVSSEDGIPALELLEVYTEKEGFRNKHGASNLYTPAIQMDSKGRFWMAQVGLTVFDGHAIVSRYDVEDGIPNPIFHLRSTEELKDGYLAFGCGDGLVVFHPDSLRENSVVPTVTFTDFQIFGNAVGVNPSSSDGALYTIAKSIAYTDELRIPYEKKVLTFEFAVLDFTDPGKNQYAYKLEGFDREWIYSGTKRNVTYTNLDPGKYVLRIKGANNDGIWNESGASIAITILPPIWRTWWAYGIYVTGFVGLLLLARKEILKRERMKGEIRLKELEASKFLELERLRSRFFTNISHEFRTPLTLLINPLEDRIRMAADPVNKRELEVMLRNARRLLNLVNQLLDLSRLEAGTMKLVTVHDNLNAFVGIISASFMSIAQSRHINFEYIAESEIDAWFDPDKMEKIVTNLLSNAFKFTDDGGLVSLKISRQGESVKIVVSDSGIGIPPDEIDRVFDRFYRVDHRDNREYEGSGIGLSLVKELVELHGGSISVTSEFGKGTCFSVLIPLAQDQPERGALTHDLMRPLDLDTTRGVVNVEHKENGKEDVEGFKLLIVEDNEDLRNYLTERLECSYSVFTASDGRTGVELAELHIPDLIISDLMMPYMDGLELCRAIKSNEKTSHIPIILLTAKADVNTRIDAFGIGADEYLSKPFDITELFARIRNLIELRQKLRKVFSTALILRPSELKARSLDEVFLKKVTEAVERNLSNTSFSVELLAGEMAMSSVQLYRKLKSITGLSPNEIIRNLRLERAASLLAQRAGSIAGVALEVGFQNLSYFTKCFKERFGKTPTEFVKRAGDRQSASDDSGHAHSVRIDSR
ncbi:MAG TPA: ATP-binding protein, partial [Cyclobacteriaceae bacterium]|nr:ATP-binding protein [Cyclobacteriaceae bacterium]